MTVGDLIARLEPMDPDLVLGELDGETVTVAEGLRRLHRTALLPPVVPESERLSGEEWAEAVIVRGEAPYGRCPFCRTAKGVAGCLNLCDLPGGMVRESQDGLHAVLAKRRAATAWLESLGGCTCPPPQYSGYQAERDGHERPCPMS